MDKELLSALYRITEGMNDSDPMKWRLREVAMSVFEVCVLEDGEYTFQDIKNIKMSLKKILSLLDVASATSYVAHVDFDSLHEAYKKIVIPEIKTPSFKVNDVVASVESKRNDSDNILQRSTMGRQAEKKFIQKVAQDTIQPEPQKTISDVAQRDNEFYVQPIKEVERTQSDIDADIKRDKETMAIRHKKVLEYLDNTISSSIGELMKIFGDSISDKTIQRDLNDLMTRGLVRAEGDKRWRRYFAVHE